jgi:hypothetical protein
VAADCRRNSLKEAFCTVASSLTRRIKRISKFAEKFLDELHRYNLCRTFRFQFAVLAQRIASASNPRKSRGDGKAARRVPKQQMQGLAMLKHQQAEARRADLKGYLRDNQKGKKAEASSAANPEPVTARRETKSPAPAKPSR